MQIKLSTLKDFFSKSAKIKSNGVIPIYNYLLIECDRENISIIKTNGNAFIKQCAEEENKAEEKYLVEEKRLVALVRNAKGDFINITAKGKKLILKDAANEIKLEAMDGVNFEAFPKFPGSEGAETFVLTPDVVSALFVARNFAATLESNLHFVYALKFRGKNVVFATNRHILYLKEFEEEVPALALSPEICSIVCPFNSLEYYTAGNYDFFNTGNTVYGFIKTEYTAPDFSPIIDGIDFENKMTINKDELFSFCKLVESLAVKEIPILKFEENDGELLAYYEEAELSTETEKVLKVEGEIICGFALNNGFLKQALDCIGTDDVVFHVRHSQKPIGVTHPDEKGLTLLIMPVMFIPKR